jgi:hypothetical protein
MFWENAEQSPLFTPKQTGECVGAYLAGREE